MHIPSLIDASPLKLETMDYGNCRERSSHYYGVDPTRGPLTHHATSTYSYPHVPNAKQEPIVPHSNDILMGRGGKNNQHVGNEQFRQLARLEAEDYNTSSKKIKSNIAKGLVTKVRQMNPPGRFLKRNPITSEWEDVGDEYAREKASQVLRDAVALLEEASQRVVSCDKQRADEIKHSGRNVINDKKRAFYFEETPERVPERSHARFPPLKRTRVISPAAATPPQYSSYVASPPSWRYQVPMMPALTPPSIRRRRSNNFFERSAFFTSPTMAATNHGYARSNSSTSLGPMLASPALSRRGSLCPSLTGDFLPGESFLLTSNHERQPIEGTREWNPESGACEEFLSEFF